MVFNPSSVDRLTHVWIGAFLAGAFLVMSVHAYYILKGRHIEVSKKAFKIALIIATFFSLSQLFTGHRSANGVAHNQPAKLAAFEGHFAKDSIADMYVLGWVDKEKQEVTGLKIPGGLSFLLHGNFEENVTGLNAFEPEDRPSQVNAVFQFYHLMVMIGMLLIGLTLIGCFLWWKGKLFENKFILWSFVFAALLPQLANQFGWFAAEMGRQPWVVYGLLRTSDAFSKAVTANQVLTSLVLFMIIYTVLFLLFIYLLNKKIKHGPYDERLIDSRSNQKGISDSII